MECFGVAPALCQSPLLATENSIGWLAKRLDALAGSGSEKLNGNFEMLRSLIGGETIVVDSIVQDFVRGEEYTVDVFADFDGRPRCAVPRLRHEVRGGEVSKGQAIQNMRMMREHCRLVGILGGCQGMMTIQCFLTPDNDIVFIEINSRFGGGVPLSIQAGADSPRWILELLLGQDPDISMNGWTDGMLMLRYDKGIFLMAEDLPERPTVATSFAPRSEEHTSELQSH